MSSYFKISSVIFCDKHFVLCLSPVVSLTCTFCFQMNRSKNSEQYQNTLYLFNLLPFLQQYKCATQRGLHVYSIV